MIRLLLDQGLPRSSAPALRELGWDTLHLGELGLSKASDEAIVQLAFEQDRVVVTLDSDFPALLANTGAFGPSVLYLRMQGLDLRRTTELLRKLLPKLNDELQRGCIASVNSKQIRLRSLPIFASDRA